MVMHAVVSIASARVLAARLPALLVLVLLSETFLAPVHALSSSQANAWYRGSSDGERGGSTATHCRASFELVAEREVSDKYVSYTLDVSTIHNDTWGASYDLSNGAYRELVKQLSPAYMRMGGTGEDALTYDLSDAQASTSQAEARSATIPDRVMTKGMWDEINSFAAETGLEIVFGLNNFKGWADQGNENHSLWDSSNARELIRYTLEMNYPVTGWELGNEPDLDNKNYHPGMNATILAAHFRQFFNLLEQLYPRGTGKGTPSSPFIIGPDTTKGGAQLTAEFLAQLPATGTSIGVQTWHQYYVAGPHSPVTASQFTDPAFLDKYRVQAAGQVAAHRVYNKRRFDHGADPVQLWMGETGGAGGATAGATEVNGHFLDAFWYADKLGIAAQLGHAVVCRQSLADLITTQGAKPTAHFGPQPVVHPAYWLALLWKRIMGTQVLPVSEPADKGVFAGETSTTAASADEGVETQMATDPGHGICSENPTPCGCLRVYAHAAPKAPAGQRVTVCVINLGSTSQDVRGTRPPSSFTSAMPACVLV